MVNNFKNVRKSYLEAKIQFSEGTLFFPKLKVKENNVVSEKWISNNNCDFRTF